MEIRIYNFVFELYEDPQDFLIDCDGTVYDRKTLEVNQQCEVQQKANWKNIAQEAPELGTYVLGTDGEGHYDVCVSAYSSYIGENYLDDERTQSGFDHQYWTYLPE